MTKLSRRRNGGSRGGVSCGKSALSHLLRKRVDFGEVIRTGRHYPGRQTPIVPGEMFDGVQSILYATARDIGSRWVGATR